MSYSASDLADSIRTVRNNTVRIAEEIPEEKYDFAPAPGTRTVAQLLTHIALGHRFQKLVHQDERRKTLTGIDFVSLLKNLHEDERKPRTKAEIVELLKKQGEAWAGWIEGQSGSFMDEAVGMPEGAIPRSKTRFEMLLSTKEHEMHHRGQLMLIQRMLGIVPHLTREMQERLARRAEAQAAAEARAAAESEPKVPAAADRKN
jgi:uncharacterized damage-inducible protein DinB